MPSGSTKNQKGQKEEVPKDAASNQQQFKIVVRRLPRGFTEEELRMQVEPLENCTNFWFRKANKLMDPWSYTRAYIVFNDWEKAVEFKNKFNGYVFIDKQGNESPALIELSVHQDAPKNFAPESHKNDRRVGTLEERPEYKAFLDEYNNLVLHKVTNFDELIREVEEKEKRMEKGMICETPLVKYLLQQAFDKEKKRIARLEKHKPSLLQKAEGKNVGDKENKRNRRKDDRSKKPKDDAKQIEGAEKKKPDKPKRNDDKSKRNDDAAKPEKPKRSEVFAKPDKPKRTDDQPKQVDESAKPVTNGTAPSKKRGSRTKSKEFAEFGNVKPKLLMREPKSNPEDQPAELVSNSTTEKKVESSELESNHSSIDKFLSNDITNDEKRRRHAQKPERQLYRPPARERKEKQSKPIKEVET